MIIRSLRWRSCSCIQAVVSRFPFAKVPVTLQEFWRLFSLAVSHHWGHCRGPSGDWVRNRLWLRLLIQGPDGDRADRSGESVLISWGTVIVSSHSHPLQVLHSHPDSTAGKTDLNRALTLRHLALPVCVNSRHKLMYVCFYVCTQHNKLEAINTYIINIINYNH